MTKLFIFLFLFLGSCASYMEQKIGEEFQSIQPDFTNIEMKTTAEGTVYNGGGGFFASDRRAASVGDIITITLEESLSAANSGSETLSKTDAYTFDLPEALFGPSSLIGKLFFKDGVKENNLRGGTTQAFTGSGTAAQANSLTGTISVTVAATNEVSQPLPFSQGETVPVQNADIEVAEPNKPMFLFQPGVDLRQIVDAVNQVGATPSSLIAIVEALKSSGSLRAELVII
mgnify:CR=1 FL=1